MKIAETIELVKELYKKDKPVSEIARRVKISRGTVKCYVTVIKKGFDSYHEYQEH